MKKRKPLKFLKFKVNLFGWDTGDWAVWLEEALVLDLDKELNTLTISLNSERAEQASRKIAEEAINAFLVSEAVVDLRDSCIAFSDDTGTVLEIDLSTVDFVVSPAGRDALIARLQAVKYDGNGGVVFE